MGKIKNNLVRTDLNVGDSIIPIEFYVHPESNKVILICPPDPTWADRRIKMPSKSQPMVGPSLLTDKLAQQTEEKVPRINSLISNLMEEFDTASVPSMGFNFTRYHIINNNYDKFVAQASICLEEMMDRMAGKKIWVAGYSFGALIALNLALRRPEINGFIMISRPLLHYDFISWISSCKINGLIVSGTADENVQRNVTEAYVNFLLKKNINASWTEIPGANHRFGDRVRELSDSILNYIDRN